MSQSIQDHFQDEGPQTMGKILPNFIKKAPQSPPNGASNPVPKKAGIALDSLEPVIVSGVSSTAATSSSGNLISTGPNPNIPSPQNFAGSQKGLDLMQNGDAQQPRGDPQYVGLTKLTYQASTLQIAQSGTVEVCNQEDFNECFIEQTINHYYKQGKGKDSPLTKGRRQSKTAGMGDSGEGSSPERTGTSKQRSPNKHMSSSDGQGQPKDEKRATQHLLQLAKRTPYDYCKLSFVITLPYEMMIEQLQFQLPAPQPNGTSSSSREESQTEAKQEQAKKSKQTKTMNIVSSQASPVTSSHDTVAAALGGNTSFSSNFKILNISSLKNPEIAHLHGHSTESRAKKSNWSRKMREHRHVAIKSAFSEDVTGKNAIEVNLCTVTKYLHVTLLCLRQDVAAVIQQWKQQSFSSSRKSKTSAFEVAKPSNKQQTQEADPKISGAQRLIAEIEDFDILDEHDQEVAFISKQHYQKEADDGIVDHEQIAMQLRGEEEDFDRDVYDEDLTGFKVGSMINNDEDDLRILDSLPNAVKPKVLQNSFNSKKQTSNKQQKSAKTTNNQNISLANGPLGHFLDKIVVYGFNCNSIPAITNLTYFMNQSLFMRKNKKPYQAEEVDYLVGTLMVTTKRATQAGEYYRKMQATSISKIKRNISKLDRSSRVSGEEQSSNNATFLLDQELRTETQNLFIECALYELIIADGLSFETQINEKIQALGRLVTFTEGQLPQPMRFAPQVLVADDAFSAMLKILPQLLRFCILSLTHRREIIRVSALKILKFILETQGCSLDSSMIFILKGMFLTFPRASVLQKQQAEKEEKLKKMQHSLDDSPSAKSASTQKALEEQESATQKQANDLTNKIRIMKDDFDLAMLVGEQEAQTMTVADYIFNNQQVRTNWLLNSSANGAMMQNVSDSHVVMVDSEANQYATRYQDIVEPHSGFTTALQNIHSHVLETYISVLSSISSHILHRIFYDVIEDAICSVPTESKVSQVKYSASFKQSMNSQAQPNVEGQLKPNNSLMAQASQIKVYACKIAEKIITICQGDLNISFQLLNSLVNTFSSSKPVLPVDGNSNQALTSMKGLWTSIKQKVFPNYSTKGYRKLVEWISVKMDNLLTSPKATPQDLLNTKPVSQRNGVFPDELSDEEEITMLQLCEVVNIVSFNRLKQQEEASQLIKLPPAESFGNGPSAEMYILLPQLLFWLEYSIDREDRLQLFTQLYQTIKEVMESVPTNGRSKENQLSIVSIVMPSLRRTNEFLKFNSPSLPMLKFLDITLTDLQLYAHERKSKQQNLQLSPTSNQGDLTGNLADSNAITDPLKLQSFFLEMLENFVASLAYSFYQDQAFIVFDKLLYLSGDTITEAVIKKSIVALVDKYTSKSKSHKASLNSFMKTLMDVKVRRPGSLNNSRAPRNNHMSQGSPELDDFANESSVNISSYFEVMSEFCFFENVDTAYKAINRDRTVRAIDDRGDHNSLGLPQLVFRGPIDMHELFVDKLQFFIDSLALMTEAHIGMFTYLITNQSFKTQLLAILEHGETNVRMKAHEILEALTSYFVQFCPSKTVYEFPNSARDQQLLSESTKKMEAEFIAHERLYISQIVIQVAKKSLQQTNDSYLQFNALILLDFLFQNLLPVPSFQNEQVKARNQNRRATAHSPSADPADVELTMDIEVLSISDRTPELDVMDPTYLRMRMKLVLSLWPHIQAALASPWSNIRSICYGLVCSMLKINVADYPSGPDQHALSREFQDANPHLSEIIADQALSEDRNKEPLIMSDIMSINAASQNRLKEIVIPMLYNLLSSKESESKAGGLNILGSFCGLSYDFTGVKINQNLAFLQRNSQFISLPIWRLVYQLQDDWDITIKEASVVLVQLCAPRNAILYFQSLKEKRQHKKLQYMMNQMPNIQSIYVKKNQADGEAVNGLRPESRLKIKNFLITRNEFAGRAYTRFPSEADKEVVLGKKSSKHEPSFSLIQESTVVNDGINDHHGNFIDYLSGKIPIMAAPNAAEPLFVQMANTCQMIEQENQILADKIHQFNPEFEDARFAGAMSRKRQLMIELDMPNRNRKDATNMNFFVDTYSDDQIQEIISIFRNDFKPPKNLWIEKQPSPQSLVSGGMSNGALMSQNQQSNMRSQSPDYYQDIYAEAIEQFNQQQAQMQQQQQAQLQQQVQSGSSSPSTSRESSSPLSTHSQSSDKSTASPTKVQAESAASTAARLSPQPNGRMIDALEDDQLRQYSEENQAKLSNASSASSKKSSHHTSSEDKNVHNFEESKEQRSGRSPANSKENKSSGVWSPDTEALVAQLDLQPNGGAAGDLQTSNFSEHMQDDKHGGAQQVPYKSESMGLLDAEGYKFLEASDSNSDGMNEIDIEQQETEVHGRRRSDQPEHDMIYEMRPPVPQKSKVKSKPMKIEQLDFDNIQIFAQPPNQAVAQAKQNSKKTSQQNKKKQQALSPQQQQYEQHYEPVGSNRIEFYQEPCEQQAQSSSRLGQRSSRLQLQEDLKNQQKQVKAKDETKMAVPTQLMQKLKSPTDKLTGGANKGTFKSFNEQDNKDQRRSNERKRKRSTTGPNSGQNQLRKKLDKVNQLKLVENDYFSAQDQSAVNFGNQTQKYQGAPSNWAWPSNQVKTSGNSSTRHRAKSIGNTNSLSVPEFNGLQNKLNQKIPINQTINGPQDAGIDLTVSKEQQERDKISRKLAQTYLSGLSQGYITNLDNLKLINNCLHQDPATTATGTSSQGGATSKKIGSSIHLNKSLGSGSAGGTSKHSKKMMNKSYENLSGQAKLKQSNNNGSLVVDLQLPRTQMAMPQTQRSQRGRGKNSTLSTSPKRRDGSNTGSGSHRHRKQRHSIDKAFGSKKVKQMNNQRQTSSDSKGVSGGLLGTSSGSHRKQASGPISDLHNFIEMMEIDLTEQFRSGCIYDQSQATPSQIRRQVEDQMRLFGLDPKSGNNQAAAQALALKFSQTESSSSNQPTSQEKKRKRSMPPKLKLIGLAQALQANSGMTHHDNTSGAVLYNQNITPSNISSNGSGSHHFMAKSHLNIHTANQFSGSTQKRYNDGGDRKSSGSRPRKRSNGQRDRSGDSRTSRQRTKSGRLSTGRGASSGSGGRGGGAVSHQVPYPPMVMTERCMRPARPATGTKAISQEKQHIKNSKSFTKGYGSALSKIKRPSLSKTGKQQTFSPPGQQSQTGNTSLVQQIPANSGESKGQKSKGQKLNKSYNKGGSNSAMNHQIVTNGAQQADKQLLQQILSAGGSTSVRNSDFATTGGAKTTGSNGKGMSQVGSPFFSNSSGKSGSGMAKATPGSTKGSQTNRFQANLTNNMLYELLQQQQQKQVSKKGGKTTSSYHQQNNI